MKPAMEKLRKELEQVPYGRYLAEEKNSSDNGQVVGPMTPPLESDLDIQIEGMPRDFPSDVTPAFGE